MQDWAWPSGCGFKDINVRQCLETAEFLEKVTPTRRTAIQAGGMAGTFC